VSRRAAGFKKEWRGELGTPIPWTGPPTRDLSPAGLLGLEPEPDAAAENRSSWDRAAQSIENEQCRKLSLLASHYGLDVRWDTLIPLILRLAMDTVPGFAVDFGQGKAGRRKEWSAARCAELIADAEAVKIERGCKDSEACHILAQSPRFKSRYGRLDARTLQNQLGAARKRCDFVGRLATAGTVERDLLIQEFALDSSGAEQRIAAAFRTA
jgi:hypothetical protein